MFEYLKIFFISVLAVSLVLGGVILAGTITAPAGVPTSNFYTLEDIYNKLTDANYAYQEHDLSPTVSADTPTMYSLEDIFDAVPTYRELDNSTTTLEAGIYGTTTLSDIETNLLPENIASGTVMFGVTGMLNCSLPN